MTLHLTLKKKWFDMIASGEKKEEYREIKPYWINRFQIFIDYNNLSSKQKMISATPIEYDIVKAKNGYQKDSPEVEWEHIGIRVGKPNPKWCNPEDIDKDVFILSIGNIISKHNID